MDPVPLGAGSWHGNNLEPVQTVKWTIFKEFMCGSKAIVSRHETKLGADSPCRRDQTLWKNYWRWKTMCHREEKKEYFHLDHVVKIIATSRLEPTTILFIKQSNHPVCSSPGYLKLVPTKQSWGFTLLIKQF